MSSLSYTEKLRADPEYVEIVHAMCYYIEDKEMLESLQRVFKEQYGFFPEDPWALWKEFHT